MELAKAGTEVSRYNAEVVGKDCANPNDFQFGEDIKEGFGNRDTQMLLEAWIYSYSEQMVEGEVPRVFSTSAVADYSPS